MRSKPLLITLAVVLLLGGIYAFMVLNQEEVQEPDQSVTGGQYVLTDLDPTTIMGLRYVMDGQEYDFTYTVYGWQVTGREAFPLDQSLIETMVEAMCKVTSDRMLTNDRQTFSQYGLDPAVIQVELEDSSGNVYNYNIGDKHPTTSKFYFNTEGSDEIYTVPTLIGRSFANYPGLASLMALPSFPAASPSTTTALTISRGGVSHQLVYLEEGDSSCYTTDYKWFYKSGSQLLPLSTDKVTTLLSNFTSMGFQSGAEFADDPSLLAKYGLDDNYYTISISYESASRGAVTDSFYVGQGEDGRSYGRLEGSDVIGLLVNTFAYFDFDYEKHKADDFFKMTLDTVDSMTILLEENRYVIKADRQTETGDDGAETVTTSYTFNGASLSQDAVTSFFNTLRDTQAEGAAPVGASSAQPYLEITFQRNTDNHQTMTLRLWQYDSSFYLSEFNGQYLLINKLDVQEIVSALQSAVSTVQR